MLLPFLFKWYWTKLSTNRIILDPHKSNSAWHPHKSNSAFSWILLILNKQNAKLSEQFSRAVCETMKEECSHKSSSLFYPNVKRQSIVRIPRKQHVSENVVLRIMTTNAFKPCGCTICEGYESRHAFRKKGEGFSHQTFEPISANRSLILLPTRRKCNI